MIVPSFKDSFLRLHNEPVFCGGFFVLFFLQRRFLVLIFAGNLYSFNDAQLSSEC